MNLVIYAQSIQPFPYENLLNDENKIIEVFSNDVQDINKKIYLIPLFFSEKEHKYTKMVLYFPSSDKYTLLNFADYGEYKLYPENFFCDYIGIYKTTNKNYHIWFCYSISRAMARKLDRYILLDEDNNKFITFNRDNFLSYKTGVFQSIEQSEYFYINFNCDKLSENYNKASYFNKKKLFGNNFCTDPVYEYYLRGLNLLKDAITVKYSKGNGWKDAEVTEVFLTDAGMCYCVVESLKIKIIDNQGFKREFLIKIYSSKEDPVSNEQKYITVKDLFTDEVKKFKWINKF